MDKIYEIDEIDGKKYISLNEFAQLVEKKPKTILRRKKDIPVIEKFGNEWYVLSGTRYPCKVNSFKVKDNYDKRYVLIKAIDNNKYINSKMLQIYPNEFDLMLRDFVNAGLIEENYNGNTYGANGYSCTDKGAEIIKKSKTTVIKVIKALLEEGARVVGIVAGEVLSRTFTNSITQ